MKFLLLIAVVISLMINVVYCKDSVVIECVAETNLPWYLKYDKPQEFKGNYKQINKQQNGKVIKFKQNQNKYIAFAAGTFHGYLGKYKPKLLRGVTVYKCGKHVHVLVRGMYDYIGINTKFQEAKKNFYLRDHILKMWFKKSSFIFADGKKMLIGSKQKPIQKYDMKLFSTKDSNVEMVSAVNRYRCDFSTKIEDLVDAVITALSVANILKSNNNDKTKFRTDNKFRKEKLSEWVKRGNCENLEQVDNLLSDLTYYREHCHLQKDFDNFIQKKKHARAKGDIVSNVAGFLSSTLWLGASLASGGSIKEVLDVGDRIVGLISSIFYAGESGADKAMKSEGNKLIQKFKVLAACKGFKKFSIKLSHACRNKNTNAVRLVSQQHGSLSAQHDVLNKKVSEELKKIETQAAATNKKVSDKLKEIETKAAVTSTEIKTLKTEVKNGAKKRVELETRIKALKKF